MSEPSVANDNIAQLKTGGAALPPETEDTKPLPLTKAAIGGSTLREPSSSELGASFPLPPNSRTCPGKITSGSSQDA